MLTPKPKTMVELFEGHPERWINDGSYAKTSNGNTTLYPQDGVRGCLLWALDFVYGISRDPYSDAHVRLYESLGLPIGSGLCNWNDAPGRTHADIVELCRKANV